MTAPHPLLQHPWLVHLGWALVHFLWQGALLGLVLAVVLRGLKRQSAEVRYAAACAAMVVMAVLPAFTLAALIHRAALGGPDTLEAAGPPAAWGGGQAVAVAHHGATQTNALISRVVLLANQSLPWLVIVWAMGVMLLLARLVGGWVGVARARRDAIPISNWVIRSRLIAVSLRMGIPRTVQLLESAYVTGPAVVGILRPVVLFPVAALTGLWPIQVEAILAHELAHIRRHDYLVNLVQSFIETLLFYHPAVWWVSRRIRQEREHCCDDMAVRACGNNVFYATALADLDDLRMPPLRLACAATGGALLPRIRRLVMPPPNQAGNSGFWAGGALACVLLLAGLAACLAGSGTNGAAAASLGHAGADPGAPIVPLPAPPALDGRLAPDDAIEAPGGGPTPASLDSELPPVACAAAGAIGTPSRPGPLITAAMLAGPVPPDARIGAFTAAIPNAIRADLADEPTDLLARQTVLARRRFHRSPAQPAVQLPMEIPEGIVARVRREVGYWPLGATSIRVTPNGTRHVLIGGKFASQNAAERDWIVDSHETARFTDANTLDVVGDILLCIDPGTVYRFPFEVLMRTQSAPHSPGKLATSDAQVMWFAPTEQHATALARQTASSPADANAPPFDLMLHPIPAYADSATAQQEDPLDFQLKPQGPLRTANRQP